MLIGCHDTLCVTQFSWLRHVTPSGESPVYRSGLIFGLISNQFQDFYTTLGPVKLYLLLNSVAFSKDVLREQQPYDRVHI